MGVLIGQIIVAWKSFLVGWNCNEPMNSVFDEGFEREGGWCGFVERNSGCVSVSFFMGKVNLEVVEIVTDGVAVIE